MAARTALPWLLLVGCLGACAAAAPRGDTREVLRIPFTLTPAGNISVRAVLDDVDSVDLMFHTAVSSVSLTKATIARLTQFAASGSVAVQSWGGTTQARQSRGNALRLGGSTWRDLTITEDDNSGPGTDGKFGPDLFAGRVVEVDFDARELIVQQQLPAKVASWQALELAQHDGALFVVGEVVVGERRCATEFLLHTGFAGTALLDEAFVRAHDLAGALATIRTRQLTDSYGNKVETRTVRLPSLGFGVLTFADVPAGIFDGALGGRRMSLVGCGLLKRCNLVFDAERRRLYATPSKLAAAPYDG